MIVLDSSGWIEFFVDGPNATSFENVILNTLELIVSSISVYEVYRRISLVVSESHAVEAITAMKQANIIEVTTDIALFGAQLSLKYKSPWQTA